MLKRRSLLKDKCSGRSHESIEAVKNISERSLVCQVDRPKIALLRIYSESGTMDHQHTRFFQQVQYKLFIRTPTQLLRFDHQVEGCRGYLA